MQRIAELNGVGFAYPSQGWLFRDLSLTVDHGDLIALVGPSGSGKSTLLAIIGGLAKPIEGDALTDPVRTTWVFQTPSGIPRRTALDLTALALLANGETRREANAKARRLLDQVGLSSRIDAMYRDLSGGEAQRVCLAQALATGRPLLLLDEPTAQLDPETAESMADVIASLAGAGRAVVIATHDERLAQRCKHTVELGFPVVSFDANA